MSESDLRIAGLQLCQHLRSWPGRIAVEEFSNRPEAEQKVAFLLENLRYKFMIAIPQLRRQIAQRNFEIQTQGNTDSGFEIFLTIGEDAYSLHQQLAKGYRFIPSTEDEDGGYCSAKRKIVEVPMHNSHCTTFPYDVLHETHHSHSSFLREDPTFSATIDKLNIAYRYASEDECQRLLEQLRASASAFHPLSDLATKQHKLIVQVLRNEIDLDRFSMEDEKIQGAEERNAWNFAERIAQTLEQERGFDFGMDMKERQTYANLCLSSYAIPRLQVALYRGEMDGLRDYTSPFLPRADMPEELSTVLP